MRTLIFIALVLITAACGKPVKRESVNEQQEKETIEGGPVSNSNNVTNLESVPQTNLSPAIRFDQANSDEIQIKLTQPTVIIIQMDSFEIEQLKRIDGGDNFYTGADDLMWYDAELMKKMDSLNIPVKYTDQDRIELLTKAGNYKITKDSTFNLYTYFFYNGEQVSRSDLFELLEDIEIKNTEPND